MNKVEEMKTFVQVVESGGISKAAAILGLAKSAISRRISDLEARLSVQLFNRSTRRLSLTDTGREFYQHCQRLLNDIDEVESNITSHHQKISGKIRLSAPLSFSIEHLAPAIKQFSERYPDVSFDLDLNDRRVNLIEENFDCAIRIGVLKDSQLVARKLFALRLSLLASQSYLDKHGIPSGISDLNQHIMIDYLLHQRENLTGVSIDGRLEKAQPKVAHACSDAHFMCQMAMADLGLILIPSFIAQRFINDKKLVPLLCDYTWTEANAYIIYPPTRHLSYRIRAFIDHLVSYFG